MDKFWEGFTGFFEMFSFVLNSKMWGGVCAGMLLVFGILVVMMAYLAVSDRIKDGAWFYVD